MSDDAPKAVLVVGATGAFGERLSEGLVRAGLRVVGAARDGRRLERLAVRLGPHFTPERVDRELLNADTLRELRGRVPHLVAMADASGPFQSESYDLPLAAIRAGLHYVDLADGRAFVDGISALNEEACHANVAVLSGASSTPALSHAVLDVLTAEAAEIVAIEVSISPGNRAPRGLSVVRSILSTVGQPLRVFRGGRWVEERGWSLDKSIMFPGARTRSVALCDTPDLDQLVKRYHPTADAIFRAGLELRLLHSGISALGLLVRRGLMTSLAPLARPLRFMADLFKPFGTDCGFMRIEALCREQNGGLRRRIWTLTAEAGDGPYVPTLPALAALKQLAHDQLNWRGAAPCIGMIGFRAIANEFAPFKIHAETTHEALPLPLFRRMLGLAFDALPLTLQQAHDVHGVLVLEGTARTTGPQNRLGRLIAQLFRLPPAGSNLPVRVEMRSQDDGSESWTRYYPGVTMHSILRDEDAATIQVSEIFGPLSVRLQWSVTEDGLALRPIGARLFGLRLPSFLVPRSNATETIAEDGRFHFDVPIALPLIGRIVHYRGTLEVVSHGLPELSRGHPIVDLATI